MSSWTFKLYFNSVWVSIANLARLGHRVPWWPTWKSLARDSQQPDNRWLEVVFVFCLCSALLQASWNLKPEQVLSSGNLWVTLAIWIQVPVPILSIMMNMNINEMQACCSCCQQCQGTSNNSNAYGTISQFPQNSQPAPEAIWWYRHQVILAAFCTTCNETKWISLGLETCCPTQICGPYSCQSLSLWSSSYDSSRLKLKPVTLSYFKNSV